MEWECPVFRVDALVMGSRGETRKYKNAKMTFLSLPRMRWEEDRPICDLLCRQAFKSLINSLGIC